MQDYLASNTYLATGTGDRVALRIFSAFARPAPCGRCSCGTALPERGVRCHGKRLRSIDNYLREALGADEAFRATLRQRFLEPQTSS